MEDRQIKDQAYFLNIDFDFELFSRDHFLPGLTLANKEWDYLLLWLLSADDKAILHAQYDDLFLKSIEKHRGFRPLLVNSSSLQRGQMIPYWGNWDQYKLKRVYADKASLIKKLATRPFIPTFMINHEQLGTTMPNELPSNFPLWVLRPGLSFGGKGIQIFPPEHWNIIKSKLSVSDKDWVLMPWLNRVLDVGTIFKKDMAIMSYLNFVDKRGSYRGSYLSSSDKDTLRKLTLHLENEVPHELKSINGNYASDSFFYKDDKYGGNVDFYPFIEFNLRKTMGSMLYLAPQKIAKKSWFGWFLIPAKDIKTFPENIHGNGWSIHTTSPSGKKFWTFYLAFDDENDPSPKEELSHSPDKYLALLRDHLSFLFEPEHNLHHFQIQKW